jgi:putative addiction module component (TIGR02574 family)
METAMTPAADQYLADLLQLPPDNRGEIATRLLESLDPAESDVEAAWSAEIRTRIGDVRSGRVAPVPWSEARAQILADNDGEESPSQGFALG